MRMHLPTYSLKEAYRTRSNNGLSCFSIFIDHGVSNMASRETLKYINFKVGTSSSKIMLFLPYAYIYKHNIHYIYMCFSGISAYVSVAIFD